MPNSPQVYFVSQRLRGALTKPQADALDYITYRLGHSPIPVNLRNPLPVSLNGSPPLPNIPPFMGHTRPALPVTPIH